VDSKHRFLAAMVLAVVWTGSGLQAAGNNWMAEVDGEKYLYELSIPGTHDSGHSTRPGMRLECSAKVLPSQNSSMRGFVI